MYDYKDDIKHTLHGGFVLSEDEMNRTNPVIENPATKFTILERYKNKDGLEIISIRATK